MTTMKKNNASAILIALLSCTTNNVMGRHLEVTRIGNVATSCQEMAAKLNENWMRGYTEKYDGEGDLGEWLSNHGVLLTGCSPHGYPEVQGPCTDGWPMDHIASTWVGGGGNGSSAMDMISDGVLNPFPAFPSLMGLIYDPSSSLAQVQCGYPVDAASDNRQDKGCGPRKEDYYFGINSIANQTEIEREDRLKWMRQKSDGWTPKQWWDGQAKELGEIPCHALLGAESSMADTLALSPMDSTSMESCRDLVLSPGDIWNKTEKTSFAKILLEMMVQSLDGSSVCNDTAAACATDTGCPDSKTPLEWLGACSWPPQDFQSMLDAQLEIISQQHPGIMQWNEIILPLTANQPDGGVQALFLKADISPERLENAGYPQNYTDYVKYAAHFLADSYYGGIPVVLVNTTKGAALRGELFTCPEKESGLSNLTNSEDQHVTPSLRAENGPY